MRTVTSATVFQDSIGMRMSMTYSEVDEETGKIIADNKRTDRVITGQNIKDLAVALLAQAQEYIDTIE